MAAVLLFQVWYQCIAAIDHTHDIDIQVLPNLLSDIFICVSRVNKARDIQ